MTHVFYVCDGVLDDLCLEFGEEVEDGLGVVSVSHERVLQQLTGRRPQVRVLHNNAGLNLALFLYVVEGSLMLMIHFLALGRNFSKSGLCLTIFQ